MSVRRSFQILLGLVMSAAVAAQTPTILPDEDLNLMVLEHREKDKILLAKVPAKAGTTASPLKGKPLDKIRVLPGNALAGGARPGDIVVEFQRGNGIETGTVCAITIRYFADARGFWVPHFRMNEEMLVTRGPDGRWRPLNIGSGAPSFPVLTGTSLPNADGFFPTLEFGLTNGMLHIDSWTIR